MLGVEFSEIAALVLEHLIELLRSCLSILVVLVDQNRSGNQLVEAFKVVLTSILFLLADSLVRVAMVGMLIGVILLLIVVDNGLVSNR